MTRLRRLSLFVLVITLGFKLNAQGIKEKEFLKISVDDYKKKVYSSWIGQIVGNTYGLGYEFKFVNLPGPKKFPYGYDSWYLKALNDANGAFSDDDTDIEYMYLLQMEKHGIEPTYKQLSEAWKYHVREKVWCANRMALNMMKAGYYPPYTGAKTYNSHWTQIDPQLVNEIWATTAPGMVRYASEKSSFAARITNDGYGIEPTVHYAAMYSAAFFEKDVAKLIDIGTKAIGRYSRFGKIVEECKTLYERFPIAWDSARAVLAAKYFVSDSNNRYCWPAIDAQLNGACGIMALLYGEGDFQKTLDYSCAFGFDADNQAATMCGLLALINGVENIPTDLLYPIPNKSWRRPFNDIYVNKTRHDLPDVGIQNMTDRMAAQGIKIILKNGGRQETIDGKEYLLIDPNVAFTAPLELNPMPEIFISQGEKFQLELYAGGNPEDLKWKLTGELPEGFGFEYGMFKGACSEAGSYKITVNVSNGMDSKDQTYTFTVRPKNLAMSSESIVYNTTNKRKTNPKIELIKDGRNDAMSDAYISMPTDNKQAEDYYGYTWSEPQTISRLSYTTGVPGEFEGWWTSFRVQKLSKKGNWVDIKHSMTPEMNLENNQWSNAGFLNYEITFKPIETKGIRIIGTNGAIPKDPRNAAKGMEWATTISELEVY